MHTNGTSLRVFTQIMSEDREVADSYVAILGALRLSRPLASGNSILVTSTQPGEGKTTVAACLAMTASLTGQSVLLIDGDLRRSSLALAIGVADTPGLIETLLDEAEAAEAIHSVSPLGGSVRGGLVSLMTGGRKAATYLTAIDWSRARGKFRLIAQSFGTVLIDSPPILAANDALLLAKIVDGALLVVDAGNTNLDELRRAKELLDVNGTPIIGTVLNKFDPKLHGRSNQPYRGYNGHSDR
jgi:capsular exopolysaccharide synthesis family protein